MKKMWNLKKKSKILALTEKCNFTDFHTKFSNNYLLSDSESNPLRQYQIKNQVWFTYIW